MDGQSNASLIQAGVDEVYDPTTNGVLVYAWWEILPNPTTPIASMTVSPGDSVTCTVTQVAGTTWGISVVDNTNGERFATKVHYAGPETSAEWIVEAPSALDGTIQQLGDYTPNVTFAGLAAAGHGVAVDQLTMVQNGQIVSSPSPLDPNGFTVAYGPNPPAAP